MTETRVSIFVPADLHEQAKQAAFNARPRTSLSRWIVAAMASRLKVATPQKRPVGRPKKQAK